MCKLIERKNGQGEEKMERAVLYCKKEKIKGGEKKVKKLIKHSKNFDIMKNKKCKEKENELKLKVLTAYKYGKTEGIKATQGLSLLLGRRIEKPPQKGEKTRKKTEDQEMHKHSINNITHLYALDKSFGLYEYLTDKEHKVFTYLCRRANKESIAYPSMETIAVECGIKSKSTVSKIIHKLQELNLIVIHKLKKPIIQRHQRIMNVYEIQHPDKWKVKPIEIENDDYIDSKKFDEAVMFELKKHKQLKLFEDGIRCVRTQSVDIQHLESDFSQNCERKDIYNRNLTKEKDITEKVSETDSYGDKNQKNRKGELGEKKTTAQTKDFLSKNSSANADISAKTQQEKIAQDWNENFKKKEQSDFEGKPVSAKTRYKLYAYRQFYKEYLDWKWERLSKDQVLFFLINTEDLIDNGNVSFDRVLKEIWRADKDGFVRNPVGWLIERFSIGRGRFYFLLGGYSRRENKEANSHFEEKPKEQENKENAVKIRKSLVLVMKKYSIPEKVILEPLPDLNMHPDNLNYIFELRIINYLWKNVLSKEEKQKIIFKAKEHLRELIITSENERKETFKSLIINEVKMGYVDLSIEERIELEERYFS